MEKGQNSGEKSWVSCNYQMIQFSRWDLHTVSGVNFFKYFTVSNDYNNVVIKRRWLNNLWNIIPYFSVSEGCLITTFHKYPMRDSAWVGVLCVAKYLKTSNVYLIRVGCETRLSRKWDQSAFRTTKASAALGAHPANCKHCSARQPGHRFTKHVATGTLQKSIPRRRCSQRPSNAPKFSQSASSWLHFNARR